MGEIGHQHIYRVGAAGSRYQSISDLTQDMNEWNEAWPLHRELHALLFMNSVWPFWNSLWGLSETHQRSEQEWLCINCVKSFKSPQPKFLG